MSKVNRESLTEIQLTVKQTGLNTYQVLVDDLLNAIRNLNHSTIRNGNFQDGDRLVFTYNHEGLEDFEIYVSVYHLKQWLETLDKNLIIEFEIHISGVYFRPDNITEAYFKSGWLMDTDRDYKSLYLPVKLNIFAS